MYKIFKDSYEVYCNWDIYSLNYNKTWKRKILKQKTRKNWYKEVQIWKKFYLIHRLVAKLFLWDIEWKVVCHLDNDKQNNNVNNLYIWTQKENMEQCVREWRVSKWEHRPASKLTIEKVREIRKYLKEWTYLWKELSKMYWVDNALISKIKLNKSWVWA